MGDSEFDFWQLINPTMLSGVVPSNLKHQTSQTRSPNSSSKSGLIFLCETDWRTFYLFGWCCFMESSRSTDNFIWITHCCPSTLHPKSLFPIVVLLLYSRDQIQTPVLSIKLYWNNHHYFIWDCSTWDLWQRKQGTQALDPIWLGSQSSLYHLFCCGFGASDIASLNIRFFMSEMVMKVVIISQNGEDLAE